MKVIYDGDNIDYLYGLLKRGAKKDKFMSNIFFGILEHESCTARKKARESGKYYGRIKRAVWKAGKAMDVAKRELQLATMNSDKY